MDAERVREWESRCIEEQPPACTAACPLRLDVRAMQEKLKAGDFNAAYAIYARFVPFPAIISHLCDHPCETVCRRAERGGAVRIGALEQAVVAQSRPTPRTPQRSRKPKVVAIVGAGLAGLTAASDLAMKGHRVTVLEAASEPLPSLRQDVPSELIARDLDALMGLGVVFRCDSAIVAGDGPLGLERLIAENDAVLLAIGSASAGVFAALLGQDAGGRIATDPVSLATSHAKVFGDGHGEAARAPIIAVRDGRRAAASIDRLLQGASLTAVRADPDGAAHCVFVNTAAQPVVEPVEPVDPAGGYTRAEAMREAARCFPCHCLECVKACAFLAHYKTYPKRTVREIYNNDSIVLGNRKSNRMIDSCALCGLCDALCPNHLGMGEVCLEARRSMVENGHMPASHHEFALRDMAYSRSDLVAFQRHQPGHTSSAAVLFPGCQLVASSPEHVGRIYRHLAGSLSGGVGLLVDCCGAPAHWSGRTALHAEVSGGLAQRWESLGRPEVIVACATCLGMFGEFHPEMTVRSLWTTLDEIGWPAGTAPLPSRRLAIHDPCTGRAATAVQHAVRRLAGGLGADWHELGGAELTTCCGFGGLVSFANPEVADLIVDRRSNESADDFLTYCAMCRDNFARRGKRALHILDLAFPPADGSDPAARADPGFSGRRDNRARFKRTMLRSLWEEAMDEPAPSLPLAIPDAVRVDMERKLILVEDVTATVAHAESTGRKLKDGATGHLIGSLRIGNVTIWVEYSTQPDGIVVHRAYSHRMAVEAKK